MQTTADKLDRRIRELELIVAVYSAALELYTEKKKAESRNPAESIQTPADQEVHPNGNTG